MSEPEYFDPLDYDSLGQSVARALMSAEPIPLAQITRFQGCGIYALTYTGDFPPYAALSEVNRSTFAPYSWPIYVGKATAGAGGRKGLQGMYGRDAGTALFKRVAKHRSSIEAARNLEVEAFQARLLTMPVVWVPMAESWAIRLYSPLWNSTVDGFGINDPGSGRYGSTRSMWDELHPGRSWYENMTPRSEGVAVIESEVQRRLAETQPREA